ncbi:MAG TPA: hypothetical protein VHM70_09325 [Polyangiaceae bacterium]|nr:hypothetical protein [Polyangiaceae bacterium]
MFASASFALTLLMFVFGPTASAQTAQPWLQDRRETQGAGIRAGNLELHPGVAAELGYDSNFFLAAGTSGEPTIPTVRLRITPSLSLSTLGQQRTTATDTGPDDVPPEPPKARFRSTLALSYDKLFATRDQYSSDVNSRSYVGADLNAGVDILPERPWGVGLTAGYTRIDQPYNSPGQLALDHSTYAGGGDLRWRPGGGLLEWHWAYNARLTNYDDPAYALDTVVHGLQTRGVWRFLPRTGLFYQGDVGFVVHRSLDARVPDSTPVASQLGVNGLITSSIGALLMGGWKSIFTTPYPNGVQEEFDNPIGRAELTWFIGAAGQADPTAANVGFSTLKLGAFHDGFTSDLANYYKIDKGYLELSAMLAGVVYLQASAGVASVRHSTPRNADGRPLIKGTLRELRQDVGLYGEYRVMKSFALFLNSAFSSSPRNNVVSLVGGTDALKYTRFTVLVGARWFL